jgi:hypothetical protein
MRSNCVSLHERGQLAQFVRVHALSAVWGQSEDGARVGIVTQHAVRLDVVVAREGFPSAFARQGRRNLWRNPREFGDVDRGFGARDGFYIRHAAQREKGRFERLRHAALNYLAESPPCALPL